jgi:hypothetical protein
VYWLIEWVSRRAAHLVVTPFFDHAFSVSFQKTHAGMGAGHTAVTLSALPSHSTNTTLLSGPGQRTSFVTSLPRVHATVLVIVAAYDVEISRGGVREDSFMAESVCGRTMSIWPMPAVTTEEASASSSRLLIAAQGRLQSPREIMLRLFNKAQRMSPQCIEEVRSFRLRTSFT